MYKMECHKFYQYIALFYLTIALPMLGLAAKPLPFNKNIDIQIKKQQTAKQRWHLEQADITSVIAQVSELTDKSFIIDPRVTGKITVISHKALSKEEIYQVFLSALQTLGYAAVPSGNAIKIIPNMNANTQATMVSDPAHPGKGAEMAVRVITIHNATAAQMIPILRPLLPQWSHVSAYAPANTLIIAGRVDNIKRLVKIIKEVDDAADQRSDLITLHHANAAQVAHMLNAMQSRNQMMGRPRAMVIPDERTNRVVLSGDKLARMRLRVLVTQLDQPSSNQSFGNTEVLSLHYLNAKTVAPLLNKIAKADVMHTVGSNNIKIDTYVEAELDTNSVVVTAPRSVIKNIKAIVNRLDVRPAQVLVEALIVELNESDTKKLGIEWSVAGPGESPAHDIRGFQPGMGVIRKGRFEALVAAIQGTSGANVLSTPTVVVLNNKKASFNIGKQVSIQSTESGPIGASTAAGVPLTTSTFKQQDVGLKLDVKPQINSRDSVLLDIEQHDGSLQNPENPTTTPIINKSDITTTVMINSGDTLVLGGLISNNLTNSVNKTPLLGDIPVVGELFTYRDKRLERKKLMVFIHPVILHHPLDGTRITENKYRYIRNLQVNMQNPWRKHRDDPAERVLPPSHNTLQLPKPF